MAFYTVSPAKTRLHYEERGTGPAVVLLNGLSQSTANWRTQMRMFEARFRMIAFDARGQGRSELGEEELTLDRHADDTVALLDHLELGRAALCGFSHGARVALRVAATYPDRVAALVLTSIGDEGDPLREVTIRGWRRIVDLGGVEALAWASLPTILGGEFLAEYRRQLDGMIRATKERNDADGIRALLDGLLSYPAAADDASRLEVPTLLISSNADRLVSSRSATDLAARIPGCDHIRFDDCGHTIPIERPDAWRDIVMEFLDTGEVARASAGRLSDRGG